MSTKDDMGDRFKGYEDVNRIHLTRRMPCIIRVDGRAFHTLTADMVRPWDSGMIAAMTRTALYLCENIQNARLAYVQSDEISILLTDYARLNTEAWFDKNLQKMVSISAAMATLAFNKEIREYYPRKEGMFDSRAFCVPREDVNNYFYWRQKDATRNSVQMLARTHFSHKSLHGLNNSQLQEKLHAEKGIIWNDTPTHKKRGACVRKMGDYVNASETQGNLTVPIRWGIDYKIPQFNQYPTYVNSLLLSEDE